MRTDSFMFSGIRRNSVRNGSCSRPRLSPPLSSSHSCPDLCSPLPTAPNIDLQPSPFQTDGQFVFPLSPFHAPHTVETPSKPKDSDFGGDSEVLCALKGGIASPNGSGVKQLIWPPRESEAVCGVTSTRWRLGKPSVLCSRDKFGE